MDGADVWIVSVKATFVVDSTGKTELASEQEPVTLAPQFRGDPSCSSLLYDSDLLHTKPVTDVVLHGNACAPTGEKVRSIDVSLKLEDISKTLRVFGDRYWRRALVGLKMTEPEPFARMPIVYERAFGGVDKHSADPSKHDWDGRNPIGTGFAVDPEHLVGRLLPNIEYPNRLIASWKDRPDPAGFGPVPGHWSPRCKLSGTYDDRWKSHRFPLLPTDFDERFYLSSPSDQRPTQHLKGGETVTISNIGQAGLLRFRLPRVALRFQTEFTDGIVEHRGLMHSLILAPDTRRVIMLWTTVLPCHAKVLKLLRTIVTQKQVLWGRDTPREDEPRTREGKPRARGPAL